MFDALIGHVIDELAMSGDDGKLPLEISFMTRASLSLFALYLLHTCTSHSTRSVTSCLYAFPRRKLPSQNQNNQPAILDPLSSPNICSTNYCKDTFLSLRSSGAQASLRTSSLT